MMLQHTRAVDGGPATTVGRPARVADGHGGPDLTHGTDGPGHVRPPAPAEQPLRAAT